MNALRVHLNRRALVWADGTPFDPIGIHSPADSRSWADQGFTFAYISPGEDFQSDFPVMTEASVSEIAWLHPDGSPLDHQVFEHYRSIPVMPSIVVFDHQPSEEEACAALFNGASGLVTPSSVPMVCHVLKRLPGRENRIPMRDRVLGDAKRECHVTGTADWVLVFTPGIPFEVGIPHLLGRTASVWISLQKGTIMPANGMTPPSQEPWLFLVAREGSGLPMGLEELP